MSYLWAPITNSNNSKAFHSFARQCAIVLFCITFMSFLFSILCHMRVFYSSFWCHPFDHNKCNGLKWFSKMKNKKTTRTFTYFMKMVKKKMKNTYIFAVFSQPDRIKWTLCWVLYGMTKYLVWTWCVYVPWLYEWRREGMEEKLNERGASKIFMIKMFYLGNFRFQMK